MISKIYTNAAAACVAAALTGCAATPVAPTQCVAPPPVVLPTRPSLAIESLPKDASPDELLQAYTASLYQCVGYTKELRILLKPRYLN